MKKIVSFTLLVSILFLSAANAPASGLHKRISATVTVWNGMNFYGTIQMTGGGYLYAGFPPTSSTNVGSVSTGTYTVTLTTDQPGTHLYQFTGGYSQSSGTGSATFTNVVVTGNSIASIF
jgi:hypothetical protein